MKKLPFVILLFTFSALANAQSIHYIDNTCANNGNGAVGVTTCASTSGGNGPWNSLMSAFYNGSSANGCHGVSPGDHIQIRGHTYNETTTAFAGGYDIAVVPSCSGSSAGAGTASNPVIIENYPGENVIVDGTMDIHGSTWTAVGGGVFKCTGGQCTPWQSGTSQNWAWIAWYVPAGGGAEQEIYAIQYNGSKAWSSYTCDSTVPEGYLQLQSNLSVCVHLPGGVSPATATYFKIPYLTNGIGIANYTPVHDVTFRHNPSGGSFTVRRVYGDPFNASAYGNYNIIIDGLDLSYGLNRCIDIDNNVTFATSPQNDSFTHNHIHHCGQEGIHMGADTLTETFSFNEVDHIQIPPWFQHTGSDSLNGPNFTDRGVGVRAWCYAAPSPNGCYFGNNVFHDSGGGHSFGKIGGINFEVGAQNALVENNLFYNLGPLGSSSTGLGGAGIGIQISPLSPNQGCSPCTFRNNRFFNIDDGISLEAGFNYNLNVYNNTFVNYYEGGLVATYGTETGTISVVNNIFYWSPTAGNSTGPSQGLLGLVAGGGGTFNTTGAFSKNSFYCSTGCTGNIVSWNGSTYSSSTITSTGNNTWGDPKINLTATGLPYDISGSGTAYAPWNEYKVSPPGMYLTSTSGSAYQLGQVISPVFPDYLGTTRPTGGAWDIGANAYISAPPVISAPSNVTLQ